jgi:hypothetical protein
MAKFLQPCDAGTVRTGTVIETSSYERVRVTGSEGYGILMSTSWAGKAHELITLSPLDARSIAAALIVHADMLEKAVLGR